MYEDRFTEQPRAWRKPWNRTSFGPLAGLDPDRERDVRCLPTSTDQ